MIDGLQKRNVYPSKVKQKSHVLCKYSKCITNKKNYNFNNIINKKICTYIINDKLYLNNIVYIFSYPFNLY